MRSSWAPPVVAVLLLLALWELVVRVGVIPESSIPPATSAIGELAGQVTQAAMWKAVGNTLTVDEEIAKLKLVVDVAREVWGTA